MSFRELYHFASSTKLEGEAQKLKFSDLPEQRNIADAILDFHNNELFYFQTSGSTGKPKTISFTKSQVDASILQSQQAFDLKNIDTALITLPMRYVAGKMMLYRALKIGMNVICAEPSTDITNVIGQDVSFAAFVPPQVSSLMQSGAGRKWLESIRIVLVGGGAISSALSFELAGFDNDIFHTYGMTETLTHVAIKQLSRGGSEFYIPLPNVDLSSDADGVLTISAHHLELTVITNDVVKLNDDQSFKVLGRLDNVINSGGLKIHPEELEEIFRKYTGCDVVIRGLQNEKWGEAVALIIESEKPIDPEWINAAKNEISKNKWPKSIMYLESLPKTASGKLIRSAIDLS